MLKFVCFKYTTAPTFPDFGQYKVAQQGFTIDMWVEDHTVSSPGDVMLDSTLPSGQVRINELL